MNRNDIDTLREMQKAISSPRVNDADLGVLAERLLKLRDELRFIDTEWFHTLTQQIATLDSASTFAPSGSEAEHQLCSAINEAIRMLLILINNKTTTAGCRIS